MSDPRYKNGVWQGNGYQHRRRLALDSKLDSPLFHGWIRAGETADGYSVFSLQLSGGHVAKLRAMTPKERFDTGHDWLVCIGEHAWGFSGSVTWVTEQVEALSVSTADPAGAVRAEFAAAKAEFAAQVEREAGDDPR